MPTVDVPPDLGIILVDHGSVLPQANAALEEVVRVYQGVSRMAIVEAAHMDLAQPTIAEAFAACVRRGARRIVVHPYFLAPGRHSTSDIPRLVAEAARSFPQVPYVLTDPLGLDRRIAEVIHQRVLDALTAVNDPKHAG